MTAEKIKLWIDGEVWEFVRGEEMIHVCCDCGSIHALVFEGTRGKRARVRIHLRPRMTASYRKRARLKWVPRV